MRPGLLVAFQEIPGGAGGHFCVRFWDVNSCNVPNLGATEAIPQPCRAGGCRKHWGCSVVSSGVDGSHSCAQHAVKAVTEGN